METLPIIREEVLTNYIGSKRRFVEIITSFVPGSVKTITDPMCGVGHVLADLAKRPGVKIFANDVSPLAYYYTKGLLEGSELEEIDINKLINARHKSGYLTNLDVLRPEKRESRRKIDGLIDYCHHLSGSKKWTGLAVCSGILQSCAHGFAAFVREHEPYTEEFLNGLIIREVNILNKSIAERKAECSVTNKSFKDFNLVKSDLIYFDPPYFPKDLQAIDYSSRYKIFNSTLLQKESRFEMADRDGIQRYLSILSGKSNILILSLEDSTELKFDEIKKKHNKSFTLSKKSTGGQAQGFNGQNSRRIKELLLIFSDYEVPKLKHQEVNLFQLQGYNPKKITDAQLNDDFRLVSAKYATMVNRGKTEFSSMNEIITFGKTLLSEIIQRGNLTFHPEWEVVEGRAVIKEE